MKTQVICFANNKGGSGKSTTCANVGYGLTQLGKKVLLIDGDMQLNLSLSFFSDDEVLSFNALDKCGFAVICDGVQLHSLDGILSVKISKSEYPLRLINFKQKSFFERL